MKNSLLQYIILYVLVACVALVIATLARMFASLMGFDSFSTFMVFIVVFGIEVVVYLSIHVILQELMLPWIGKGLSKIPYFKNRMKSIPPINEIDASITELLSLEDIRNEQLQNRAKEQEEILNIALVYTRKTFALYLSDEHLDVLCRNLQAYINELDVKELQPVKIKELTAIDIRHFGWNIWNYSKPRNQMDIAHFLKTVFPDIFKDAEVDSIKRHLKDDELKGIIKIREDL